MDGNTTRESNKFPRGYGDFALQCSDGVICYFPRYLLEYASGFFKDMFSLPTGSESNEGQAPNTQLSLTEPSATVELLLQHIDPILRVPSVDQKNIVELLEAAQKYQVAKVAEWFEDEIRYKKAPVHADDPPSGILLENPLLVLYCALRFSLPDTGRLALKELAQCSSNLLNSPPGQLPLRVYLRGMALREKRVNLFREFIVELTRVKALTSIRRPRGPYLDTISMLRLDNDRKTCATCTARRTSWVFKLEEAIRERPTWKSFVVAYESNGDSCAICSTAPWSAYYRESLTDWESKVKEMEREPPVWPF